MYISQEKAKTLQNTYKGALISNEKTWIHTCVLDSGEIVVLTGNEDEYQNAFIISNQAYVNIDNEVFNRLIIRPKTKTGRPAKVLL